MLNIQFYVALIFAVLQDKLVLKTQLMLILILVVRLVKNAVQKMLMVLSPLAVYQVICVMETDRVFKDVAQVMGNI